MGIELKDLSLRMIRPNDHTPDSLWKGLLGVGVITLSHLSHSDRLSGLSWAQKDSASVRHSGLSGQKKHPLEDSF